MVKIEKQRLSEREGYYFHNYEPEPWVVEITGKACAQGLDAYNARITRGTTLLGKYLRSCWD